MMALLLCLKVCTELEFTCCSKHVRLLGAVLAAFLFSKVRPTDFGAQMSAGKLQEQLILGLDLDIYGKKMEKLWTFEWVLL